MVFNPVFFDNANNGNELGFFARPQKINESHYLFANILNVYTGDVASAINVGAKTAPETNGETDLTPLIKTLFGSANTEPTGATVAKKVLSEKDFKNLINEIGVLSGGDAEPAAISEIGEKSEGKVFALSNDKQLLMFHARKTSEGIEIAAFVSGKKNPKIQKELAAFVKSLASENSKLEKVFEKISGGKSKVKIFELKKEKELAAIDKEAYDEKSWEKFDAEKAANNFVRAIEEHAAKKTDAHKEGTKNEAKETFAVLQNVLQSSGDEISKFVTNEKIGETEIAELASALESIKEKLADAKTNGATLQKIAAKLDEISSVSGMKISRKEITEIKNSLEKAQIVLSDILNGKTKAPNDLRAETKMPAIESVMRDVEKISEYLKNVKLTGKNYAQVKNEIKKNVESAISKIDNLAKKADDNKTFESLQKSVEKIGKLANSLPEKFGKNRSVADKIKLLADEFGKIKITLGAAEKKIATTSSKASVTAEDLFGLRKETDKLLDLTKTIKAAYAKTKATNTNETGVARIVSEKVKVLANEIAKFDSSLKTVGEKIIAAEKKSENVSGDKNVTQIASPPKTNGAVSKDATLKVTALPGDSNEKALDVIGMKLNKAVKELIEIPPENATEFARKLNDVEENLEVAKSEIYRLEKKTGEKTFATVKENVTETRAKFDGGKTPDFARTVRRESSFDFAEATKAVADETSPTQTKARVLAESVKPIAHASSEGEDEHPTLARENENRIREFGKISDDYRGKKNEITVVTASQKAKIQATLAKIKEILPKEILSQKEIVAAFPEHAAEIARELNEIGESVTAHAHKAENDLQNVAKLTELAKNPAAIGKPETVEKGKNAKIKEKQIHADGKTATREVSARRPNGKNESDVSHEQNSHEKEKYAATRNEKAERENAGGKVTADKEKFETLHEFIKRNVNGELHRSETRFANAKETARLPLLNKNEVIERLANYIQKRERATIEFQLNPEHLGKLKVALDLINDTVKAHISVETQSAKALIENNLNELYSQLNKSGIQFNEVNISLNQHWQKNERNSKTVYKNGKKLSKISETEETEDIRLGKQTDARLFGYNTYEYLA